MISSQDANSQVADRIERAYRRRHLRWAPVGLTPGVWSTAAGRLFEICRANPDLPVDPEMFVAVQDSSRLRPDPWMELAHPRAQRRYVQATRRVVAGLRRELKAEVRLGELRALRGEPLERVVTAAESRLSPLSQYIIAHRAGRDDLARLVRRAARSQDASCPLYRLAARPLLPAHLYPSVGESPSEEVGTNPGVIFSLN